MLRLGIVCTCCVYFPQELHATWRASQSNYACAFVIYCFGSHGVMLYVLLCSQACQRRDVHDLGIFYSSRCKR